MNATKKSAELRCSCQLAVGMAGKSGESIIMMGLLICSGHILVRVGSLGLRFSDPTMAIVRYRMDLTRAWST